MTHTPHKNPGPELASIFDDESSRFEVEESFTSGDRIVQRWRYS